MKPFQSRVVAAWIVALPIAYGLFVQLQHRLDRLKADPQVEELGALVRRLFPERAETPKPVA